MLTTRLLAASAALVMMVSGAFAQEIPLVRPVGENPPAQPGGTLTQGEKEEYQAQLKEAAAKVAASDQKVAELQQELDRCRSLATYPPQEREQEKCRREGIRRQVRHYQAAGVSYKKKFKDIWFAIHSLQYGLRDTNKIVFRTKNEVTVLKGQMGDVQTWIIKQDPDFKFGSVSVLPKKNTVKDEAPKDETPKTEETPKTDETPKDETPKDDSAAVKAAEEAKAQAEADAKAAQKAEDDEATATKLKEAEEQKQKDIDAALAKQKAEYEKAAAAQAKQPTDSSPDQTMASLSEWWSQYWWVIVTLFVLSIVLFIWPGWIARSIRARRARAQRIPEEEATT